jgi:hypothetical protein
MSVKRCLFLQVCHLSMYCQSNHLFTIKYTMRGMNIVMEFAFDRIDMRI